MAKFGKRSLDNLKGVHPNLVKVLEASIIDTPIDFTIVQGVRDTKTQQEYYSWGRTKINPNTKKMTIVTYVDGVKRKSNHQIKSDGYGHAVDLYAYINGSVQVNDVKSLKIISDHIKKKAKELGIKITWGGDWKKPYDPPHFELSK